MPEFIIQRRILYHDTDAGGLDRGVDLAVLMNQGTAFPVVHPEMEFKAPARYGDVISIATQVEKIGTSSVHFRQEIKKDRTILVRTKTVWACVDGRGKSQAVGEAARQALLR
jgi:acyl-CoA thioester hydrolase